MSDYTDNMNYVDTDDPAGTAQRSKCPEHIRQLKQHMRHIFRNCDDAVRTTPTQFNYVASATWFGIGQYHLETGRCFTKLGTADTPWDYLVDIDDGVTRLAFPRDWLPPVDQYTGFATYPGGYSSPLRILFKPSATFVASGGQAGFFVGRGMRDTQAELCVLYDVCGAPVVPSDLDPDTIYECVLTENAINDDRTYRIKNLRLP